jgi:hypothetical protein
LVRVLTKAKRESNMFEVEAVKKLQDGHRDTLESLVALQSALNARFYGMERTVN